MKERAGPGNSGDRRRRPLPPGAAMGMAISAEVPQRNRDRHSPGWGGNGVRCPQAAPVS
jgi:hypothetical protein